MSNREDLKIVIEATAKTNGFTKVEREISKLEKTSKSATSSTKKLGEGFGGLTNVAQLLNPELFAVGAAAGIVGKSFKDGIEGLSDFSKGMAKVNTLLMTSRENLKSYYSDFNKISIQTGINNVAITEASYESLSASFKGSKEELMGFELEMAKASKAGFTSMKTSVDGVTTVLNSYNLEASKSKRITEIMLQTQADGKTTFGEIASSISNVIPEAAALDVNFSNVSASIAVLTASGTKTAEATTEIRAALSELAKEGTKASTSFEKLTGTTFKEFIDRGHTLGEALQVLADGASDNGKALVDMFSSIEAGQAALGLTGDKAQVFKKDLDDMNNSVGQLDKTYKIATDNIKDQWDILSNHIKTDWEEVLSPLETPIKISIEVANDSLKTLEKVAKYSKFINPLTGAYNITSAVTGKLRSDRKAMTKETDNSSDYIEPEVLEESTRVQEEFNKKLKERLRAQREETKKVLEANKLITEEYNKQLEAIRYKDKIFGTSEEEKATELINFNYSKILEYKKSENTEDDKRIKSLELKIKHEQGLIDTYKKQTEAKKAAAKAVEDEAKAAKKAEEARLKIGVQNFNNSVNSYKDEINNAQKNGTYSLSDYNKNMDLFNADIAKTQEEELKRRRDDIAALKSFGDSIYNVADLMDSKLLKSIGGVVNSAAGFGTSYMAYNSATSPAGKAVAGLGMASSGASLGTSVGGNALGSTVGAGIGTAAGMAIGGPVGAMVGSAAGGIIGGMVGPTDHSQENEAKWAKDSAEAAAEFKKAVDKFSKAVHDDKETKDIIGEISKYQNAEQSRSEIYNTLQSNRYGGRGQDTILTSAYNQATKGLTEAQREQLFKTYGGSGHIEWKDYSNVYGVEGSKLGISSGKGKHGVDTNALATGIYGFYESQIDTLETELKSVIGATEDDVKSVFQNGIINGANASKDDFKTILGNSMASVVANNSKTTAKNTSDVIANAMKNVALDKNGVLSEADANRIKDTIKTNTKQLNSQHEIWKQNMELLGYTVEENGNLIDANKKQAEELSKTYSEMLGKAMKSAVDDNDLRSFNKSLGESIYDSVYQSMITAFKESYQYRGELEKYFNSDDFKKEIEGKTTTEVFKIMNKQLGEVTNQLRANGLDYGYESATKDNDHDLSSSSYIGDQARQTITYNQYYFNPSITNAYKDTREELFEQWQDWKIEQDKVSS